MSITCLRRGYDPPSPALMRTSRIISGNTHRKLSIKLKTQINETIPVFRISPLTLAGSRGGTDCDSAADGTTGSGSQRTQLAAAIDDSLDAAFCAGAIHRGDTRRSTQLGVTTVLLHWRHWRLLQRNAPRRTAPGAKENCVYRAHSVSGRGESFLAVVPRTAEGGSVGQGRCTHNGD